MPDPMVRSAPLFHPPAIFVGGLLSFLSQMVTPPNSILVNSLFAEGQLRKILNISTMPGPPLNSDHLTSWLLTEKLLALLPRHGSCVSVVVLLGEGDGEGVAVYVGVEDGPRVYVAVGDQAPVGVTVEVPIGVEDGVGVCPVGGYELGVRVGVEDVG